jgi:hypothetical protein
MGRLASRYADLDIQARFPYTMDSELVQAASVNGIPFPGEDFLNVQDKVFEVHRMIPRVYGLGNTGLLVSPQPDMELLMGLVLIAMTLQGFNQQVNKSPTRLGTLVKGSAERTWEFADPLYLPNGRGLQVFVNTTAFPVAAPFDAAVTQLLVAITFEGFLIQTSPPRGV